MTELSPHGVTGLHTRSTPCDRAFVFVSCGSRRVVSLAWGGICTSICYALGPAKPAVMFAVYNTG